MIVQGEKILEALDDRAVKLLRRHKLIWSGWQVGEMSLDNLPVGHPFSIRSIEDFDSSPLRSFFHSLLWRAAATDRYEFSEVSIPPEDVEILRCCVAGESVAPNDFYPVSLTQIVSRGDPHNFVPIMTDLSLAEPGKPERRWKSVRFYFDGLIAHILCPKHGHIERADLGPFSLGTGQRLLLGTVPFDTSWQASNLRQVVAETEQIYPGRAGIG